MMGRRPPRSADVERAAGQLASGKRGRASKIAADSEVRAFIEGAAARLNLTELAQAALARFGADRAPSRSAIGRFRKRPRLGRWDDAEVRTFIEARAWHLSYAKLAAAALAEFGPRRAPSRSAIARYWKGLPKAERIRIFAASAPNRG